jgi:exopolysaccharide biosynthesis WecB/TagA/CpsF family protein
MIMATDGAADPVVHFLDDYDLPQFTEIAANFGTRRFGFVVTPNVDHMIRYHDDPDFRACYAAADYILLDSRLLSYIVHRTQRLALKVCTGSDLTATLFSKIITPTDRIVLIGGTVEQARKLASEYGLANIHHHNPPMGFIKDPAAVLQCLEFIEHSSPFRYCFLAVGCPQQEAIARDLKARGKASGLALCIGASLNFLTGAEKRAPLWMQQMALEWLFRLTREPARMAHRYLIRGPRIFNYLWRDRIEVRPRRGSPQVV